MTSRQKLALWPVIRQAAGPDRLGRGAAVRSSQTARKVPRTHTADRVALGHVRTLDDDAVGVLQVLLEIGRAAAAERRSQTGNC